MKIRIRKPRSISGPQFVFVTLLGLFSGFYIWKPVFTVERPDRQSITASTSVTSEEKTE